MSSMSVHSVRYKRIAAIDFHVGRHEIEEFGKRALDDASRTALVPLVADLNPLIAVGAHLRRVKLQPKTAHVMSWRWILSVEIRAEDEAPTVEAIFDHKMDELP